MVKTRLEGAFHVSDTQEGGDHTVGRVVRLEISGEILGANQRKMTTVMTHFSILV